MKKSLRITLAIFVFAFLPWPVFSGNCFIENKGQITDTDGNPRNDIICYTKLKNFDLFITHFGLSFVWSENEKQLTDEILYFDENITYNLIRKDIILSGCDFSNFYLQEANYTKYNFYLPGISGQIPELKSFKKVEFKNIYTGTDLLITVTNDKIELEFLTSNISSASTLKNIIDNQLISKSINRDFLTIRFCNPEQKDLFNDTQEFKDSIGWSSYFGREGFDFISSVTNDLDENILIGGMTRSTGFPVTEGVFQRELKGDLDCFITLISIDGKIIWSTLIGGSGFDTLNDLEMSPDSTIWYCGETRSHDYPVTSDAFKSTPPNGTADGCLGNFSNNGRRNYITLYGGGAYDSFNELAINSLGNVYFTGPTLSNNFPVSYDGFRKTNTGGYEGFIVGFDKSYNRIYSSYWGGSSDDYGEGITIDNNNNIIILGYTASLDYKTKQGFQEDLGGKMDGYLAKFDMDYNLIWSTYLGGNGNDFSNKVAHDKYNNLYLRGCTNSSDLTLTNNAIQNYYKGKNDLFIMKFDENCKLKFASYFGGSNEEGWDNPNAQFGGIDIDNNLNIAISGNTNSKDLKITGNAYQKKLGNDNNNLDAYVIVIDSNYKLIYSSYFGGDNNDKGYDVCFNESNELINVGYTSSPNFPVINCPLQYLAQGDFDGYIIKFAPPPAPKDTCDETEFYFFDFSSVDNIIFIPKAFWYQDFIRMTTPSVNRIGAFWYKYLMPIRNGFTTKFSFRMSEGLNGKMADSSLPGADGIAFVIQYNGLSTIGGNGGRIGYDPIPNSLAVEYDLFSNDEDQIEILNDPNGNHVAVMSMGKEPNSSNHKSGAELGINKDIITLKSNNTVYYSKIDYNIEPGVMRVYLSDKENGYGSPIIEVKNLDLTKLLNLNGNEWAYVGFTSATGSSYQNHDILSWEFCPKPTNSILNGIEDEEPAIDFGDDIIFPNPADDILFLNTEKFDIKSVQIIDLTGRAVYSSNNIAISEWIKISGLAAGCWILKIETTDGKILVEKFLKK